MAGKTITKTKEEKMNELKEIANSLRRTGMRCNCDLDKWQPECDTGHSWVCRIHKEAKRINNDAYAKAMYKEDMEQNNA